MKKFFALLLALAMVLALAACGNDPEPTTAPTTAPTTVPTTEPTTEPTTAPVAVMTHEEYLTAELQSEVAVEFYVQGAQGWWFDSDAGHGKITVYGQDTVGGYFVYEMTCSEEDAAKLVPGTKIRVTGYKTEWEGEVEIDAGATFEFVEDYAYVAEPLDVTALLGTDELIKHQNEKVCFKGMTVEKIEYKGGEPGNDIYVTVSYNGASYDFCVESYLTGPDTEVYTTVGALEVGDVVDIEGFLYWYQGVNTHITAVAPAATVMTHEEYMAAELQSEVVVEFYVQGSQGWWFDSDAGHGKITVYGQDENGGYFGYELNCTQQTAAKLVPGTKIRVTGYKAEWEGEVEIVDGSLVIVASDTYVAEALDVTELLGTDDLIKHQNEKVAFKGMVVEKIEYKNGEPGDDIYVTVSYNGASYDFCVEIYLTGADTEVYTTVGTLEVGDTVDIEGFLYWYAGVNTHITNVTPAITNVIPAA